MPFDPEQIAREQITVRVDELLTDVNLRIDVNKHQIHEITSMSESWLNENFFPRPSVQSVETTFLRGKRTWNYQGILVEWERCKDEMRAAI
ncbi:hypothetical protein [Paucilactobacillus nenjiangensis]|uniref:hypothetical protein n=1 Tax=Paucilactobacillus nenjiangensis TaxID=1296540 RepID=UPI003BB7338B